MDVSQVLTKTCSNGWCIMHVDDLWLNLLYFRDHS